MTARQTDHVVSLIRDLLRFQLAGKTDGKERRQLLRAAGKLKDLYPLPDAPWTDEARVAWLLAFLPQVAPDLLDDLLRGEIAEAGDFPHLGGTKGEKYRGVLPTGETVFFLLGGRHPEWRAAARELFAGDHFFAERRLLLLADVPAGEPRACGKLLPDPDVVTRLLTGREAKPHFSTTFPAERLTTGMDWEDLVLSPRTLQQLDGILAWMEHGRTLLDDWGMGKRLKPGYRTLFHGPPGTGKTLTASLLGKRTGRDVYRVDLSMVISKYIGETEKNLSNLFAKAENKDWILFFDEGDALFGKRTGVKDAHDRYANQEVSYLLQRVESYDGLVILASNFKSNIDEAFMRRFQSVIHFPLPTVSERERLWAGAWPTTAGLIFEPGCDPASLARDYEITGSTINNVVQQVCLRLLASKQTTVEKRAVLETLRQELGKEGKLV
ncbi:MAG: ATP-binding protein [Bacteroidota bacterium]